MIIIIIISIYNIIIPIIIIPLYQLGAEIAYRMTQSWIDRFGNLRRLTIDSDDKNKEDKEQNEETVFFFF